MSGVSVCVWRERSTTCGEGESGPWEAYRGDTEVDNDDDDDDGDDDDGDDDANDDAGERAVAEI